MKRILALLSIIFISGCAAVSMVSNPVERASFTSFQIGEVQEAAVGNPMIVEEDVSFYEGIIATEDFQPPAQMGSPPYPIIPAGAGFKAYGKLTSGATLYREPNKIISQKGSWNYCLAVNELNQVYGDAECVLGFVRDWNLSGTPFKSGRIYQKGSFKAEIVYNGKSQDTIRLSYREYHDDFARPAFYQDLSYDLSESRTIGFRNMKIEVLEATNSDIRFIVRSPLR